MRVVFMDTLAEDEDNYRFMVDMAWRWSAHGLEIVTLTEGRTPYGVAEDEHYIPNQKVASCTRRLKIRPFADWLATLDDVATVHIGFDFSEVDRCKATRRNYEKRGYSVDFPLLWRPVEHRPYTEVARQDWGIEPPRTYAMGFSHANCLAAGCVKMGLGDWRRFLVHFPERFAEREEWERRMRQHPKRASYALARDQSNGTVTAKTLEQIRLEVEQGNGDQMALFDTNCIHCGVGDLL
jgi:hypothetical protein